MSERDFQKVLVQHLRACLPSDVFMTHFPAGRSSGGGKAGIIRGNQLKSMGLVAGVPDILIVYNGRAYWIELKAPKGRLSETQVMCGLSLVQAGCRPPAIVRTLAEAYKALDAWGIPTRIANAA